MCGNPTLFHRAKSIKEKIVRKNKYRHNQLRNLLKKLFRKDKY